MTELDLDRTLALTYVPAKRREAIRALWRLDQALGAVVAGAREPMISQIKLAWWRDSLARLDGAKAPAEPVLQSVETHILPVVSGAELSKLEEGWTVLLSQEPLQAAELDAYAAARGGLLFRFAATLLGGAPSLDVERAGEVWALMDLARNSNATDAAAAAGAARDRTIAGMRWPSRLRPLGMIAALAVRDAERGQAFEPHGAPPRMARMLWHRLSGI